MQYNGAGRRALFVFIPLALLALACGGGDERQAQLQREVDELKTQVAGATSGASPAAAAASPSSPEGAPPSPAPQPAATAVTPAVGPQDRLRIAAISLDVALDLQQVSAEGSMPNGPDELVSIYDWSAINARVGASFGGWPGSGNTVVAARHSRSDGPRPFFSLGTLQPGAEIALSLGGTLHTYRLVVLCIVPVQGFDPIVRRAGPERLTLITEAPNNARLVGIAEKQPGSVSRACPAGTRA